MAPFDGSAASRKHRQVPQKRPKPLDQSRTIAARLEAALDGPDPKAAQSLLPALDQALSAIGTYVETTRATAAEARAGGEDLAADTFDHCAAQFEPAARTEFQAAAWRLVRLVTVAITGGDTAHVVAIAKHIEARKKREWLNVCARHRRMAIDRLDPEQPPPLRQHVFEWLPSRLAWLDERASTLSAAQIESALSEKTAEKFAARLACMCSAMGYDPKQFQKARKAFENLPAEKS